MGQRQDAEIGGQAVNGCFFTNHYSAEEKRPEVQVFVEALRKSIAAELPIRWLFWATIP